jgi:hypothetical protein
MPGFFSAENAARPRHYFTAVPAAQSISMQLNSLSSKQHDTIETFRFIPSRRPVFSNFLRLCQRSEDFAGNLSPHRFLRLADPREIRRLCGLLDPRMLNLEN